MSLFLLHYNMNEKDRTQTAISGIYEISMKTTEQKEEGGKESNVNITAGSHLLVILEPVLQLLRNNTKPKCIRVRFIPPNFAHLLCPA